MRVKLLEVALDKFKGPSGLQKALVRHGVDISVSALSQAKKQNIQSMRFDVLSAIVSLAFSGDWKAAGKVIDAEFANKI